MNVTIRFLACLLTFEAAAQASGLADLATVVDHKTLRASSFDRSGGNIDNVSSFAPGDTHVMLDTDGPGRITHIWMTMARFPNHPTMLRDVVIRMYWENASVPSVEVPVGDFFGLGHGKLYAYESLPLAVGANPCALNCYWPMPFHKHARIELYNNGSRSIRRIYYHVDYESGPIAPDQALFHSLYARIKDLPTQAHDGNLTGADNYVILETEGRGQYVGCTLSVDAQPGGWWGEGDDMIFIDHAETPTIIGTGSEDYFGNAWGYREPFSYPYYGASLLEKREDGGQFTTVYRWHVPDPVRFGTHIKVTIEHLFSRDARNDYTSVAYWYQTEPIRQRPPLPKGDDNHPRRYGPPPTATTFELDATELEPDLCSTGIGARAITANLHDGYMNGGWLRIEAGDNPVELRIPVPEAGSYQVEVKPVNHLLENPLQIGLKGSETRTVEKRSGHEREVPYLDLGTAAADNRMLIVIVSGNPTIGLDHFKVRKRGP